MGCHFQWPWLLLPAVGALIGWLTNVLAVRLIFRPHRERRVLGITVQGLIPRRRAELAEKVSETVSREFISDEDIREAFADPALLETLRDQVDRSAARFIREKFDALPALVLTFLPVDLEAKVRTGVVEEVMRAMPELTRRLAEAAGPRLDVRRTVRERIEGFSTEKLEAIVMEIARRELVAIEVLGGVLGFIIGSAQVGLLWAWAAGG